MKKSVKFISVLILSFLLFVPMIAFAENAEIQTVEAPVLQSVKFDNCKIDGTFSPDIHEYGVKLEDLESTPTLKDYKLVGDGKLVVTYLTNETSRQVGICVTVMYDGGTLVYNFNYLNLPKLKITDNANLSNIQFYQGYLTHQISASTSTYSVYVPSDATSILVYPVTEDINATCSGPQEITLGEKETKVVLTVTASSGKTKQYTFKIERLKETSVKLSKKTDEEIYNIVKKESNHIGKKHIIIIAAVLVGIAVIWSMVDVAKCSMISPYDEDEQEFFAKE